MTKPIRVLLVEDNPGDAELTRETLEAGKVKLEIDVAIDGEEALDFLCRRGRHAGAATPDVVILDLNLPKLNGGEVLAEMRRDDALKAIPVVILTSSDSERDIVRSYAAGASCYVSKPVDLGAFQAIVRSIESFWFTVVKLP
jgi:two-component system, chemotaxis family, response regulator Rcp1